MATKQEEVAEALKQTQEQLDKEVAEDTPIESPEEELPEDVEDIVDEEVEDEVEDVEEEVAPSQAEIDYKKKFSESSREAQKIVAKNRKLNQAIDEANEIPEPTDDELTSEFADWDIMSETERRLAKESIISKRFRDRISSAREETRRIEKWSDEVDAFTADPKLLIDNPRLEGKLDLFKAFATQESHNSVPFELLIKSFLYDMSAGKVKNKGKMMEVGTAGPNDRAKMRGDTISLSEAENLRKTDYKKYKTYLIAGKIDMGQLK